MDTIHSMEFLLPRKTLCEDCKSGLTVNKGYLVCSKCGLVHENIYWQDEAIHPLKHQYYTGSWVFGTQKFSKYRKIYSQIICPTDHYLKKIVTIENLCSFYQLSTKILKRSISIYQYLLVNRKKNNLNYKALAMVGLSVLIAAREYGFPLLTEEVLEYFTSQGNKVFFKDLRIVSEGSRLNLPLLTPLVCLERVLSILQSFGPPPLEEIYSIIDLFSQHAFSGCNPHLFAVACVCYVYNTDYGFPINKLVKDFHYGYRSVLNVVNKIRLLKSKT